MSEKMPGGEMPNPLDAVTNVAKEIGRMRKGEAKGAAIERRTNHILEQFEHGTFARWKESGIPSAFTLDTNGLRIDVGPGGQHGIHSHVPYQFFTPELLEKIRTERLLVSDRPSEEEWREQSIRYLEEIKKERDEAFEEIASSGEYDEAYIEKIRQRKEQLDAEGEERKKYLEDRPQKTTLEEDRYDRERNFLHQEELEARAAEAAGDTETLGRINDAQDERLGVAVFNEEPRHFDYNLSPGDDKQAIICNGIIQERRFPTLLKYSDFHIPRRTLVEYLSPTKSDEHYYTRVPLGERIMYLADFAENLNIAGEEVDHMHSNHRLGGYWSEYSNRTKIDHIFDMPVDYTNRTQEWRDGAWRNLRDNHELARVNKAVFELRKKTLGQKSNYEMAKVIETLFAEYTPEEIEKTGISMVRGLYSEDLEFIAFWDGDKYHRILLEPKKQIRNAKAGNALNAIPTVPRADFEAFEAVMLPYRYFRSLARTATLGLERYAEYKDREGSYEATFVKQAADEIPDALQGVLRIAITELPHEEYIALHRACLPIIEMKEGEVLTEDMIRNAIQAVEHATRSYENSIAGRQAKEILDERVPLPKLKKVALDESFVEQMPEKIRADKGRRYDPELFTMGASINIVEAGGGRGIPFAREGQAMRALKLERRPTIMVTGGASNLDTDGSQAEDVADAVLAVAIERRANVMVPGTQAGLGVILARTYQRYLATLSEDEKKNAPRFFAVEPGKELYYPGNDILDPSEGNSIYAVTPVDTIVTPYHAGWSKHGTPAEYQKHINYRQTLMTRASGGFPTAVITCNGGSWTIMENNTAVQDEVPIIPVSDTGRFAEIITRFLTQDYGNIDAMSDDELWEIVKRTAEEQANQTSRTQLLDDLKVPFYKKELLAFIRSQGKNSVLPTTTRELADTLRMVLEEKDTAEQ